MSASRSPSSSAPLLARFTPAARKIAVVRASRLGDFVCATPALRALRLAAPQAEIAIVTLPLLRELALRLPYVDRFIAFPGFPGIAQQFFQPDAAVDFFQRMQAERFDIAIQLQGSGVYANPFTLLLGAAATAGFVRAQDDASLLDTALVWPEHGREVQRLLALMRAIGAASDDDRLEFPLLADDKLRAIELLAQLPRPLIGVHAGSHDVLRRWPIERFAAVVRVLLRSYGGTAVIIGSLQESERALELTSAIGTGTYNLTGRTSIATLGAVIAELSLLITNDSGPAHIGYALGTPTVTIYRHGGTDRYGPPVDGPFAGLEPHAALDDPSTTLVAVAQVVAAADALLGKATLTPHGLDEFTRRDGALSAAMISER